MNESVAKIAYMEVLGVSLQVLLQSRLFRLQII